MVKILSTLFLLLSNLLVGYAQVENQTTKRDTLFEKAPLGLVRFYYDDHYFLVDKDCEFKSIERLSAFIVDKNAFHGEFKDFNQAGTVILTGNYAEGIKEGLFTAYHPNGATKWTCLFKEDKPTGDWKYYYPDGKPMLIVNYDSTNVTMTDYWNRRGKQEIIAGKGNYELMMPFDFYNEFGYPYFIRKGRIRNGLPSGYWTMTVTDNKRNRELFAEEVFNDQGIMVEGYNLFTQNDLQIPFSILPANHFRTAEKLIFKPCTFDAYSGFDTYLGDKFNSMAVNTAKITSDLNNTEYPFSFVVDLDKDGMPSGLNFNKKTEIESLNKWITSMIKEIPYYFPTLDDEGKPVEDQLTVSGVLSINAEGKSNFHSFNVQR